MKWSAIKEGKQLKGPITNFKLWNKAKLETKSWHHSMSVKVRFRANLAKTVRVSKALVFLSLRRVAKLMKTAKVNKMVDRSLENALLTNFLTKTTRQTYVIKSLAKRKMEDWNMHYNPEIAKASSPLSKILNSKGIRMKQTTHAAWRNVPVGNKKTLRG